VLSPEIVRVPGGKLGAAFVGISGLAITIFAMVLAVIPPPPPTNKLLFELKVVGGAGSFLLVGGLIYWNAHRRSKNAGSARVSER
jgi:hypothetical protein